MAIVFHARPYRRFIETQTKLRRKKLYSTNKGSNFLAGSFSNRDNIRAPSNLEEKENPRILKDEFFSRIHSCIFTPIASVLLEWSNETRWVCPAKKSLKYFLLQYKVPCRSDSSLAANSSCCHRSDAWSHLEKRVVWSA